MCGNGMGSVFLRQGRQGQQDPGRVEMTQEPFTLAFTLARSAVHGLTAHVACLFTNGSAARWVAPSSTLAVFCRAVGLLPSQSRPPASVVGAQVQRLEMAEGWRSSVSPRLL